MSVFPLIWMVGLALQVPEGKDGVAHSALWGAKGERWSAQSRLPDYSYAGYHRGEDPLPEVDRGVDIRTFGAKGDGKTDDTRAFLSAIQKVDKGAIEIPAGRYVITQILEVTRPGIVLRGVGPERSILVFPTPLHTIRPNMGATTTGRPTSNYSWSGGFVWVRGDYGSKTLAQITGRAKRGDVWVTVSATGDLRVGQRVEVYVSDTSDNSLAGNLYSGESGPMENLKGRTRASHVSDIVEIQDNRVRIDRPLRFDLEIKWKPVLRSFEPKVREVGVEHLGFEFPKTPYQGHFTELGYNPVALNGVADCWIRDIILRNADSGPMISGCFNTIEKVVHESSRETDRSGNVGHHGIYFGGNDNLYTGFDYRARYVHDISVSHCSGNVIASGRGVDLCFDHHRRAPFENLFTDIDAGEGRRLWACGGGAALGKHCGARGTFWNIRSRRPLEYPNEGFGPRSMNLVGLTTDRSSILEPEGKWFEAISPGKLKPSNLHEAQRALRFSRVEVRR